MSAIPDISPVIKSQIQLLKTDLSQAITKANAPIETLEDKLGRFENAYTPAAAKYLALRIKKAAAREPNVAEAVNALNIDSEVIEAFGSAKFRDEYARAINDARAELKDMSGEIFNEDALQNAKEFVQEALVDVPGADKLFTAADVELIAKSCLQFAMLVHAMLDAHLESLTHKDTVRDIVFGSREMVAIGDTMKRFVDEGGAGQVLLAYLAQIK